MHWISDSNHICGYVEVVGISGGMSSVNSYGGYLSLPPNFFLALLKICCIVSCPSERFVNMKPEIFFWCTSLVNQSFSCWVVHFRRWFKGMDVTAGNLDTRCGRFRYMVWTLPNMASWAFCFDSSTVCPWRSRLLFSQMLEYSSIIIFINFLDQACGVTCFGVFGWYE